MNTYLPKFFNIKNGPKIQAIGLGTSDMTSDISEVVYHSIKDGLRLIDTASLYGSEEGVGKGIKKALNDKLVTREELFIITKLSKFENKDPEGAIKQSLKKLDLDYIDLYLVHWPKFYSYNEKGEKYDILPMHKMWEFLESFVDKGYTRYIGVCNYNVQSLCNLLSFCKIKPIVNQVEFHPYLYQKNLLEFCKKMDIQVIGYNPLVKGIYVKEFSEQTNTDLLNEKIIIDLSKKYNKTAGQIVLNWSVCKGVIPIPMTSNIHRMKENLATLDFKLEDKDVELIDTLNKNFRFGCSKLWSIYSNDIDIFN